MLEHFKILTITHKQTHLNKLGCYVIDDVSQQKLEALKRNFGFGEFMYLSTCNRVLYFFTSSRVLDDQFQQAFFQQVNPQLSQEKLEKLSDIVEYYDGKEAMMHLFEVAASMNSLVVGEREILRQLREAYRQSKDWKLTGDDIRLAMKAAVETAKLVYSKTRIGEKPVSVVSLAIQKLLAAKISKASRILLIGAGQTNRLVAKFLKKHEFTNVTVFNRTLAKAETLADMLSGAALPITALSEYDKGFDVMIVCTGATKAIIQPDVYAQLLQGETNEKLAIDLSIPNNIAKHTVEDFPIQYIEIEDLRQLANANISFREKEVEYGREIIVDSIYNFQKRYKERQITRALRGVPSAVKEVKTHAMNNVFKKELDNLDDQALDLLNRMMSYMEKRCISIPMEAAKKSVNR